MKRYKLLKDLPFAKAGEEMEMWSDGIIAFTNHPDLPRFNKKDVRMFPLWFEEIKEPEQIYYVDNLGGYVSKIEKNQLAIFPTLIANLKSIGNYFETEEEAEKYLEYLKAKEVIKQDAKGVHFDWTDISRVKYYGVWNCKPDILNEQLGLEYRKTITDRASTIYFNSEEDIEESFEKHPEEWKTYLTYEQ